MLSCTSCGPEISSGAKKRKKEHRMHTAVMRKNILLRLILIEELFLQNFRSLEIIGDMYQNADCRRRSVTICEIFQNQKNRKS